VNRLLILSVDAAKYHTLIKAADLPQLDIRSARDVASAKEVIADCNIIIGDPPLLVEVISSAEKLEWLQSSWAGVDQLCRPGLRRDYVLTGVKGIFGPLISEYVMTYLFALERRVFAMRSNQLEKRWKPFSYRPSREITLGIIGLGSIGRHLARTARLFGIRVTGLNRTGKPCDDVENVYTRDDLSVFLEAPDYVVLTLPDTRQTRHFINADVLKMMKPSTVLMNVGRGSTINEVDLVDALRDGVIGGAVLDVFESEPLAGDNPLWQLPNAYVTPHNAATSFPEDVVEIFIENYHLFLQQETLLHVVDFDLGY
jgi:phosphoglycerate dehydrogenase-like enzyme